MLFGTKKNVRRRSVEEISASNCPQHPMIFIFSGKTGKQHGYEDGWDDEKYFLYSGEGQKGDMSLIRKNITTINLIKLKERVWLFLELDKDTIVNKFLINGIISVV